MRLAVFLSEYREPAMLERLKAEKLGIILVQNGVYHAAVKKDGKVSPVLSKDVEYYALSEDLQSRGFSDSDVVDGKVKVINYDGLVDLLFNDYEKTIWL
ncbi:MAG TPA: hypothetical protein ENJ04_07835 [Nitrospirae bacterium]|nr:hypothetical protein [Nitrospirota bacterium]